MCCTTAASLTKLLKGRALTYDLCVNYSADVLHVRLWGNTHPLRAPLFTQNEVKTRVQKSTDVLSGPIKIRLNSCE